jgi:hypothetical protein
MADKKMGGSARKALAIVRPSVIATTFSSRSEKYFRLQRTNGVLAGLYGVQALLIMIFGHTARVPVVAQYLQRDPLQSSAQKHSVLLPATHHLGEVNLLTLLVVVLLLAAAFHGLLATALRARYEVGLAKKMQDLRWWGYALIGGLMVVLTALVLGISDSAVLVMLFGLCVVMALGALAIEANGRLWPWGLFGMVAAAALVLGFAPSVLGGLLYGTALPAYVYIVAALVLLAGVGTFINLRLQIRGYKEWADYLFAEEGYMALNLVLTSAVAWVIFAGALH